MLHASCPMPHDSCKMQNATCIFKFSKLIDLSDYYLNQLIKIKIQFFVLCLKDNVLKKGREKVGIQRPGEGRNTKAGRR